MRCLAMPKDSTPQYHVLNLVHFEPTEAAVRISDIEKVSKL